MATDYEAVFEDIMRYTRGRADGVRTQQDLKRFFRENDKRNTMSDKLLDKITETRSAEELIKEQTTLYEVKRRAEENRAREKQQKERLRQKGKRITGTYTQKTTDKRFVLYENQESREVYLDMKGFARDKKGRFAKKN